MGNCIGTSFALSRNDNKVSPDEEDQDLKASAMVARKISSAPCSGWEMAPVSEHCRGALPLAQLNVAKSCNGQSVKIVVTKKQLRMLIRSVEELKSRHVMIQSIRKKEKKWKPSLATIPEL